MNSSSGFNGLVDVPNGLEKIGQGIQFVINLHTEQLGKGIDDTDVAHNLRAIALGPGDIRDQPGAEPTRLPAPHRAWGKILFLLLTPGAILPIKIPTERKGG